MWICLADLDVHQTCRAECKGNVREKQGHRVQAPRTYRLCQPRGGFAFTGLVSRVCTQHRFPWRCSVIHNVYKCIRQMKEYFRFCQIPVQVSASLRLWYPVTLSQDPGRLTCCKNADLSIILPNQCESLFWMRDELLADLELSEWRTEMVRQAWIDASQQVNIPELWLGWCVCCVSVSVGGRWESCHSSVEYVSCQSEGILSLRNLVWSYQRSRWKQKHRRYRRIAVTSCVFTRHFEEYRIRSVTERLHSKKIKNNKKTSSNTQKPFHACFRCFLSFAYQN